ncbi:minor coat protein [polyscias crinivirus 1]|nr:minor coat protein [polyscias crinivirus 1]
MLMDFYGGERQDDQRDLAARAGGGFLTQEVDVSKGDNYPINLAIMRYEKFNNLICSFYISFSVKEGKVTLKIDFSKNWEVSIRQINLSPWFSAFVKLDTPRSIKLGKVCPISIYKEGGEVIISFFNFECYKIYSTYPVDKISFLLSSPISEVDVDFNRQVQANYVSFSEMFTEFKVKGTDVKVSEPLLSYYDTTSKKTFSVSRSVKIPLADLTSEKAFGFKNVRPEVPDKLGFEDSEIEYHELAGEDPIYRLYYTWTVKSNFQSSVEVAYEFPTLTFKDFSLLQQLWFGSVDGGVETYLELKPNSTVLNVGVAGWKDKIFGTFKIDDSTLAKVSNKMGQIFVHRFDRVEGNRIKVSINGVGLVMTSQQVVRPVVQFGWEFQLKKSDVAVYGDDKFLKFDDIIEPFTVKVDGVIVSPTKLIGLDGVASKTGHVLTAVNPAKFRDVSECRDLFAKPPPKVDDSTTADTTTDSEVVRVTQASDREPVNEKSSDLEIHETSKLVDVNYYLLSDAEDKRIFSDILSRYVSNGFSVDQAKLIIYQLGVTFGTSRNCCGDYSSGLTWINSKGQKLFVSKGLHSRKLNSMSRVHCNVERQLLRRRSEEILSLLRSRKLQAPERLARKKGVDGNYAYMVCDFFDHGKLVLSQDELLTLNSVQQYLRLHNKHRRSIVNVNQLL